MPPLDGLGTTLAGQYSIIIILIHNNLLSKACGIAQLLDRY